MFRTDPGPCPICDAPHGSCGPHGPIAIAQLPQRDAAAASDPPLVADAVQATLPEGSFTSGTYRRPKKGK